MQAFQRQFEFDGGPNIKTYVIQPTDPFKLKGFLVWDPIGYIESIKVGNLIEGNGTLPLIVFKSLWSIQEVHNMLLVEKIDSLLPDYQRLTQFSTCQPTARITITICGSISHIILWGKELR
jgi:hypothetical protein